MSELTALKRLASAGDVKAMYDLGVDCADAGDSKGARRWWRKVADLGDSTAVYNLGDAC
jgi:hypothetical protein